LLENGHALNPLLSLGLCGVKGLLLLFDGAHVHLAQVLAVVEELVEGVWGVDGLVLLGRILAGILEDDLGSTGVLGKELGHVVGTAVDDDPAGVAAVVLGDLGSGELDGLGVVAGVVHDGGGAGMMGKKRRKDERMRGVASERTTTERTAGRSKKAWPTGKHAYFYLLSRGETSEAITSLCPLLVESSGRSVQSSDSGSGN